MEKLVNFQTITICLTKNIKRCKLYAEKPSWRILKYFYFVFAISFLFMVLKFITVNLEIKAEREKMIQLKRNGWKIIHIWTDKILGYDKKKFLGHEMLRNCEENRCFVSSYKANTIYANAVIFPWVNLRASSLIPQRYLEQLWIFFTLESPDTDAILRGDNGRYSRYNNLFNWTMTYRSDSDVYVPYGSIKKIPRSFSDEKSIRSMILQKSKIAFSFISNCDIVPSGRPEFITELKSYLSVDIYGNCGNFVCGRQNETYCWTKLQKKYKFYLSLENSVCRDYVTEKFFNALLYDVIPVVFGGANYKSLAPLHSYIDASDFKSIFHLANYLKRLASNNFEYSKYFEWKKGFKIVSQSIPASTLCNLCHKMHKEFPYKMKYYKNLKKWWMKYPCFEIGSQLVSRKFLNRQYRYS